MEKNDDSLVQLLVFHLGGEKYAMNVHNTKTIISVADQTITPVPQTSRVVKGITNIRGEVVPILDLEEKFDIEKGSEQRIIVGEVNGNSFGMLVDSVDEVTRIEESKIRDPPEILQEAIPTEYIGGVIVQEDGIIIILDLEKALTEEELEALSTVSEDEKDEKETEEKEEELSEAELKEKLQKKFK